MRQLLRKLRGLLGFGLTWGVAWGAVGAGIGTVIGILNPGAWALSNPILEWGLGMGMYGFVSGAGFGKLLALVEGRRTLEELSLKRIALWGLLGGVVVPPIFGVLGFFTVGTTLAEVIGAMVVTGVLGGSSAAGTVAIAQRSELPPPDDRASIADTS